MSAVETYLASLNGATPDLSALHGLGVPLDEAIALCQARHQPLPVIEEPAPVAIVEEPKPPFHLIKEALAKVPEPPKPAPRGICLNPRPLGMPLLSSLQPMLDAAADESLSRNLALSLLHDLAVQMDSERADAAALVAAGWSESFAKEFCHVIRQLRN